MKQVNSSGTILSESMDAVFLIRKSLPVDVSGIMTVLPVILSCGANIAEDMKYQSMLGKKSGTFSASFEAKEYKVFLC